MKFTILTLFPEMFAGPFGQSIVKRATDKGLIEIEIVNIRDFGIGKHKVVDDTPYGGGIGMVMRVDVLHKAIEAVKDAALDKNEQKIVYLGAHGKIFNQETAREFAQLKHLILICGHYEGVDERVKNFIDMEISIGDFILTGGEIPAMAITDAVARLVPGVLKSDATLYESFTKFEEGQVLLEHPQYTKPAEYEGMRVPEVLISGDHKKIADWRKKTAEDLTQMKRPDLLEKC